MKKLNVKISTGKGSKGYGIYNIETNELTVLKGSIASNYTRDFAKKNEYIKNKLEKARTAKEINYNGQKYFFMKDKLYKTPTSACLIFVGGNIGGKEVWKLENGMKLSYYLKKNKSDLKTIFKGNEIVKKEINKINDFTSDSSHSVKVKISTTHGSEGFGIYNHSTKKLRVLKGSIASLHTRPSVKDPKYKGRLVKLENARSDSRVAKMQNGYYYTKDVLFKNPTIAGYIFIGGENNGLTEWKVEDSNQTLKDWILLYNDSKSKTQNVNSTELKVEMLHNLFIDKEWKRPERKPVATKRKKLTSQQRAASNAKAEQTGYLAEEVVFNYQSELLLKSNIDKKPEWVSKESDDYGYDILSYDAKSGKELHIEVKAVENINKPKFKLTYNEERHILENENAIIALVDPSKKIFTLKREDIIHSLNKGNAHCLEKSYSFKAKK